MSNTVLEIEFRSSSDRANNNPEDAQNIHTSVISFEYLPRLFENLRRLHQLNGFYIAIAYIKIMASTFGMIITGSSCNQPLRTWLCLMIFYDSLVVLNRGLNITGGSSANRSSPNEENNNNQGEVIIEENFNDEDNDIEGANTLLNPERSQNIQNEDVIDIGIQFDYRALLLRIRKYTPWYYFFLFFFGNSIIFPSTSDCSTEAPFLNNLVMIYLGFQYINITIPVLVCFSILCLCSWAIGSIIFGAFNACRQRSKNKNLVNNLKVIKYPAELEGDHECSICMCSYDNGDEIIGLDCSQMHHFHAECIKKWLKVDGICPMCRMSLADMNKKSKRNNHSKDK